MNKEYLKKFDSKKKIDIVVSDLMSAEMDEMWSFCHDKQHQIWLWWAVDHETNTPLTILLMRAGLLTKHLSAEKRIHRK